MESFSGEGRLQGNGRGAWREGPRAEREREMRSLGGGKDKGDPFYVPCEKGLESGPETRNTPDDFHMPGSDIKWQKKKKKK